MRAVQIGRMIGVNYKTAWFLCHRIRESLRETSPIPLGGANKVIEADETYAGGKEEKKHAHKRIPGSQGGANKEAVVAMDTATHSSMPCGRTSWPLIVFFDALRVKIRDEGLVKNKAVYVALALDAEGHKHGLGLWIGQTEGAKFWLKVMNDLKTRRLQDILIAVVDGLKGFPEAIGAVFPETLVQTCIVHLIRNSLAFVSWKDRKAIVPDLKAIYRAHNAEAAADRLSEFEDKGAPSTPPSARAGGGPGSTSSRYSPSRRTYER